jgi:hypothetical protein
VENAILNTVFENTVRWVNTCLETGGGPGVDATIVILLRVG